MKKEQLLNFDEFKNFIENKGTNFINDLLDRFKLWNITELQFYINHIFSYKMQRPFLFLNYINNKGYSKHERNNRIKKYMNCFIKYLDEYYKEHTQAEEQQEINKSDVKAYLDINNNRILKKMIKVYDDFIFIHIEEKEEKTEEEKEKGGSDELLNIRII